MANLTLRFSLYTQKIGTDIYSISKMLPPDGRDSIMEPGMKIGKYESKEYSIDYVYRLTSVISVGEICDHFLVIWGEYSNVLNNLLDKGFDSHILFEFDIEDLNFPELCYKANFISWINRTGSELQLYFYT